MAILVKGSSLAIKVESTEGTPVEPAASTDYVALQDDFSMEPANNVLENAEIKTSLGQSKSILGIEQPTASFSHYLRHSGTEGQAPNFKELLEAVFGTETVNGTEYDTVAGSTVSSIDVDSGEGANFSRGQAVLVKNSTDGYEIRCLDSISTDSLIPGFDLANAPGTGVNLGKCVAYSPANSGHQALSLWHYLGSNGAIELMSGSKVTELGITFTAGELINASYSLEGIAYYFNPITIEATDQYLDFTSDNGTFAVSVTAKTYKDPHALAAAIQAAMAAADTAETYSVTYSNTTGKFTIATSTSAVLSLLWNTGANTANTIGDAIGFSVAADDTGATSYVADNAITVSAPQSASFDNNDPLVAKNNQLLIGDSTDTTCVAANSVDFSLSNTRRAINSICAETGQSGSLISDRTATITVAATLNQYEAEYFKKFRTNEQTKLQYAFGTKDSSGNWEAGKCGALYMPTATITSYSLVDNDGIYDLNMELTAYVNSDGDGEVYLNFV